MAISLRKIQQRTRINYAPLRSCYQRDHNLYKIFKSRISDSTHQHYSYPIGPHSIDPLALHDLGYSQFQKNIEFFKTYGRHAYLSSNQIKESISVDPKVMLNIAQVKSVPTNGVH